VPRQPHFARDAIASPLACSRPTWLAPARRVVGRNGERVAAVRSTAYSRFSSSKTIGRSAIKRTPQKAGSGRSRSAKEVRVPSTSSINQRTWKERERERERERDGNRRGRRRRRASSTGRDSSYPYKVGITVGYIGACAIPRGEEADGGGDWTSSRMPSRRRKAEEG